MKLVIKVQNKNQSMNHINVHTSASYNKSKHIFNQNNIKQLNKKSQNTIFTKDAPRDSIVGEWKINSVVQEKHIESDDILNTINK